MSGQSVLRKFDSSRSHPRIDFCFLPFSVFALVQEGIDLLLQSCV